MSSAKKINTFSFFILFVFLFSILYAVLFLVSTSSERNLSFSQKTTTITNRLQTITKNETLYSSSYYQGITDLISSDPTISAFVLNHDGEPVYIWPAASSFITDNAGSASEIKTHSPIVTVKEGYFITEKGLTEYSIAFSSITSQDLYKYLSHAFIAILTATLITLMVILYISLFRTPKYPASVKATSQKETDNTFESFSNDEDDYETEYPYSVSFNDDISSVFEEQDNEPAVHKKLDKEGIPDEFVVEAAQHQAAVHASPKKRVLKESEDPLGLFSDLTGFGWESYLETRLDSELIRAASSEYDLALFIVKIKDVERTHPAYSEICGALLSFFKFRDMVFEYGSDSFAGIVTGMDINGCMSSVEQLYTSLSSIMKKNGMEETISIGISTRCLRIIPGDRLLHEAKDAVAKAAEEPSMPIVAFKVNPGKYREYLEEEMGMVQEPIAS